MLKCGRLCSVFTPVEIVKASGWKKKISCLYVCSWMEMDSFSEFDSVADDLMKKGALTAMILS